MARIQQEDFDLGAEVDAVVRRNPAAGGTVAFLGTVKEFSKGERIAKLEFDSYPGMAEAELEKLEGEAKERFNVLEAFIIHRLGEIPLNGNIVLVIAAAVSRGAAFDACEWMIDELKKRVPIWKKEFTTSGSHWVEDHP
ncbi:MAG: molybdenum cofactor biosynthesis protein MoaE [Nitrospinae bacterium]|nr:molybdenum cofactor biosynthesis protein MoaE [Nitrospinota bacterium]